MYFVNADLHLELQLNKSVKEHKEFFSTSLWFFDMTKRSTHTPLSLHNSTVHVPLGRKLVHHKMHPTGTLPSLLGKPISCFHNGQ